MKIKILRKTDIVIIAGFLIFAVAFYFIFNLNPQAGDTVVIKVNGKIYEEVSLNENKDVEIYFDDGTLSNTVRIQNKKAFMIYADCPDGRCMRQSNNYLIVCLPNRVTVEIKTNKKDKVDIVIKK